MRFIHKFAAGRVTAIPGEHDVFTDRPKRQALTAQFRLGMLHPWEVRAAKETFRFRGISLSGEPGAAGEPNDPIHRVAYYDTLEEQRSNGWTDEYREQVEQGLLNNKFHGSEFVRVDPPALTAPWPKYDELVAHGRRTPQMVAEKIAEKVREDGYDVEHVVAYERAKRNRQEVINALLGIEETDEDVVEVTA